MFYNIEHRNGIKMKLRPKIKTKKSVRKKLVKSLKILFRNSVGLTVVVIAGNDLNLTTVFVCEKAFNKIEALKLFLFVRSVSVFEKNKRTLANRMIFIFCEIIPFGFISKA